MSPYAVPWDNILPSYCKVNDEERLSTILSLFLHFPSLSVRDLVLKIFRSQHPDMTRKLGMFLAVSNGQEFMPAVLMEHWYANYRLARPRLDAVIHHFATKILLSESDAAIKHPDLRIIRSKAKIADLRRVLNLEELEKLLDELMPYSRKWLMIISSSPNEYRTKRAQKLKGKQREASDTEDDTDDGAEDPGTASDDEEGGTKRKSWKEEYPGFSRNPRLAVTMSLASMLFVRNRATNALPLAFGLYARTNGTSARVMKSLSQIGFMVSVDTVDRLRTRISEEAVDMCVDLIKSGQAFAIVADNINLFNRKDQQRLTNQNSMIHATNAAVLEIPASALPTNGKDPFNLASKKALVGQRSQYEPSKIRPSKEDGTRLKKDFVAMVVKLMVDHAPGNRIKGKGLRQYKKQAESMVPDLRRLPVVQSNIMPFGAFDVNEGSYKGMIDLMEKLRERSTVPEEEWSSSVRIILGDYLTSRNIRGAARLRVDDVNDMERLSYIQEISQLFHFSLNALHMIVRTHFGRGATDPGSLSAHKEVLGRTWDPNKPDYSNAKALVTHSLVARMWDAVMRMEGLAKWSELEQWTPKSFDDLVNIATRFVDGYATRTAATKAKDVGDDMMAHSVYFNRDALLFCVFESAISYADPERVLLVMKYWAFSFRGCGLHNYARECLEVIVALETEMTPELRKIVESSWFVNRWGKPGRWIATDLWLEMLNFWLKRVFILEGTGVTINNIIARGSSCIELLRDLSLRVARFFGAAEFNRRHKEASILHDVSALLDSLRFHRIQQLTPDRFIPAPKLQRGKAKYDSAIVDILDLGMTALSGGKWNEFICSTGTEGETASNGEDVAGVFITDTAFDGAVCPVTCTDDEELLGEEIGT